MLNHRVELKAARLPRWTTLKKQKAEGFMGRVVGEMTSVFSNLRFWDFSNSLKGVHHNSVRGAKQCRYNYSISHQVWSLLGHFSRGLLLIKQWHGLDSSAIMNNKEKNLGGTFSEPSLSWGKPALTLNGLFRNKMDTAAHQPNKCGSGNSIFNTTQCNYLSKHLLGI